jgi:hypothetical protein
MPVEECGVNLGGEGSLQTIREPLGSLYSLRGPVSRSSEMVSPSSLCRGVSSNFREEILRCQEYSCLGSALASDIDSFLHSLLLSVGLKKYVAGLTLGLR